MNLITVVLLIACCCAFGRAQQVDYCALSKQLCGGNVTHVACNANAGFGAACVNATQIVMNSTLQQTIVQQHNLLRMQVATGNLTGFPSAANMLEMTWDDELAYVAGYNARTCILAHDACRATIAYPISGQNLGLMGLYNAYDDPSDVLVDTVNRWYAEYANCPVDLIAGYYDTSPVVVGHFTAVVQQKSGRVGCALVQFKDDHWFQSLLTCNYSYSNINGVPVYTSGTPCSSCASKTCSTTYPGLCVNS